MSCSRTVPRPCSKRIRTKLSRKDRERSFSPFPDRLLPDRMLASMSCLEQQRTRKFPSRRCCLRRYNGIPRSSSISLTDHGMSVIGLVRTAIMRHPLERCSKMLSRLFGGSIQKLGMRYYSSQFFFWHTRSYFAVQRRPLCRKELKKSHQHETSNRLSRTKTRVPKTVWHWFDKISKRDTIWTLHTNRSTSS